MAVRRFDSPAFGEALERAVTAAKPVGRVETVMLTEALGRILAEDVIARRNLPPFDNSAMDGFAVRAEDAGKRVKIRAAIFAGDRALPSLEEGECYKIMTGAQVPAYADTIVPIENCPEVGDGWVRLPDTLKKGDNLRKRGEEQTAGAPLMARGEQLEHAHIAMLSAQGITAVRVYAPLRIAVASTGDEIREPWEEATEDEIFNANAFGVTALLRSFGFAPEYVGAIPDDKEKAIAAIGRLKGYDAVITTGGISMGEADFLREAFEANGMGAPLFHGVEVKPGRPTMMGLMGETFVMAMPGNPLTTLLNIRLLCIPVLAKLQGAAAPFFPYVTVKNLEPFKMKSTRSNLVPGRIESGGFRAVRGNRIGSGMLTPLMEADCVAIFDKGARSPEAGEEVKVILFDMKPAALRNDAINR